MDNTILFLAAIGTFADPVPTQRQQGPVPEASKIICKSGQATGTRIPAERICKPKSVWDIEKLIVERHLQQNLEQPQTGRR
jgi:hypothetical protein